MFGGCSGEGREGLFLFWGVPWSWEAGRFDPDWGESPSISSMGEEGGGVLGMKGGGVSISSSYSSTRLLLLTSASFSLSLMSCSSCSLPSVSFLPSCSLDPISSDTSPSSSTSRSLPFSSTSDSSTSPSLGLSSSTSSFLSLTGSFWELRGL